MLVARIEWRNRKECVRIVYCIAKSEGELGNWEFSFSIMLCCEGPANQPTHRWMPHFAPVASTCSLCSFARSSPVLMNIVYVACVIVSEPAPIWARVCRCLCIMHGDFVILKCYCRHQFRRMIFISHNLLAFVSSVVLKAHSFCTWIWFQGWRRCTVFFFLVFLLWWFRFSISLWYIGASLEFALE